MQAEYVYQMLGTSIDSSKEVVENEWVLVRNVAIEKLKLNRNLCEMINHKLIVGWWIKIQNSW